MDSSYQAVSYVSGIQCQDLQTKANTKISEVVASEKSVPVIGTLSSTSSVKLKLEELAASCKLELIDYERLSLELIENETDKEVKKERKEAVEAMKKLVFDFIRDVMKEPENSSHIDAVKDLKRLIQEYVFNAKQDIKKLEKKKKKENQPISKKNKRCQDHKSGQKQRR